MSQQSDASKAARLDHEVGGHQYKHIGILGGMAPSSTADLYTRLMQVHDQMFGDEFYPEATLRSVSTGRVFAILDKEPLDRAALVRELVPHLASLALAGSDFLVIAANTPHVVLGKLQVKVDKPIRSIVDATRDEAGRLQVGRPLLLGTGITMTDGFFHRPFIEAGVELVTPDLPDRQAIDHIISSGVFDTAARELMLRLIQGYEFDGVILGCTELPMLIKPEDLDDPILDTVDIQARDTLSQALII